MKTSAISVFSLVLSCIHLIAGQSALNTTYQPLLNPAKEEIWIVPVICHHWYHNSASSSVDLIGVKNVPPSDKPDQATSDLNLASICGIKFSINDRGATVDREITEITIDISKLSIPKKISFDRIDVIRASIECLRLCLPPVDTPLTIKGLDKNKEWVSKIVKEFNARDRSKPFYKTPRYIKYRYIK